MSRYEYLGTRDLTFSNWHRHALPALATMIDVDCLEYCRRCRMPLALIETARDTGQAGKTTLVMQHLAQSSNVPAWCALYTPEPCECTGSAACRRSGCRHGIAAFRVRQVYPSLEEFHNCTPQEFALHIVVIHESHERNVHGVVFGVAS